MKSVITVRTSRPGVFSAWAPFLLLIPLFQALALGAALFALSRPHLAFLSSSRTLQVFQVQAGSGGQAILLHPQKEGRRSDQIQVQLLQYGSPRFQFRGTIR
jgi:hypothetical protein